MTSVNRASGQAPISVLCDQIKAFIEKGDAAIKRSEDCYLSAGCSLVELKRRESEEWLRLAKETIGISRTRAYELLKIGEGRTTVEETRARTGKRTKRARAKKSPLRSGRRRPSGDGRAKGEEKEKRNRSEKEAGPTVDDQAKAFMKELYKFVESDFKPRVADWEKKVASKMTKATRAALVEQIESSSLSLQYLAQDIRYGPDADTTRAGATASRSQPQRRVYREARA